MKETCQSCKWWRGRRNGCSEGDCRRRSPGYQHRNPGHGKTSVWPTTEHKDWCGDYEKDVPEPKRESSCPICGGPVSYWSEDGKTLSRCLLHGVLDYYENKTIDNNQ